MASLASASAGFGTCGAPASTSTAPAFSLPTTHSGLSSFYEHKASLIDGSNVDFNSFAVSPIALVIM
jgi:hypothetical protein